MRKARWLSPWKDSLEKPTIYHVVSRVVDRRFVLGDEEREHFKMLMRMYENFSGCKVLSYCVMSNHFHILLEVPPMPKEGISDEELFKRLGKLYSTGFVERVRAEMEFAREEGVKWDENGGSGGVEHAEKKLQEIRERFLYRMHDLSEFMKGLLQRFTAWFNRKNGRKGTLWEDRFKSAIVQDGVAARTMAAYMDLNPVRAGMVEDPADYRWSSYGEAVGAGGKGGGKKARAGLLRALHGHARDEGGDTSAKKRSWERGVAKEYRVILLKGAVERFREMPPSSSAEASEGGSSQESTIDIRVARKGMTREKVEKELARLEKSSSSRDLAIGKAVSCRARYFADGAVLGSKEFVDDVFMRCRDRFGAKRQSGARKPRGSLGELAEVIWTARDLRMDIS